MPHRLNDALAALYRARIASDPIGAEAARVLAAWPPDWVAPPPEDAAPHPASRHLAGALASDGPAPDLRRLLHDAAALLRWSYSYPPRANGPDLATDIAFAELIGPRGWAGSHAIRVGLTLIGPATYYPAHAHPAVELYAVLSGTADWTARGEVTARPPGAWILHESGTPHAMRTRAAPLLAVYSWTGDLQSPSLYVE
jgi:mannose-6-phosphate isomerase-like protein (cupin superfamily)